MFLTIAFFVDAWCEGRENKGLEGAGGRGVYKAFEGDLVTTGGERVV